MWSKAKSSVSTEISTDIAKRDLPITKYLLILLILLKSSSNSSSASELLNRL